MQRTAEETGRRRLLGTRAENVPLLHTCRRLNSGEAVQKRYVLGTQSVQKMRDLRRSRARRRLPRLERRPSASESEKPSAGRQAAHALRLELRRRARPQRDARLFHDVRCRARAVANRPRRSRAPRPRRRRRSRAWRAARCDRARLAAADGALSARRHERMPPPHPCDSRAAENVKCRLSSGSTALPPQC